MNKALAIAGFVFVLLVADGQSLGQRGGDRGERGGRGGAGRTSGGGGAARGGGNSAPSRGPSLSGDQSARQRGARDNRGGARPGLVPHSGRDRGGSRPGGTGGRPGAVARPLPETLPGR